MAAFIVVMMQFIEQARVAALSCEIASVTAHRSERAPSLRRTSR